MGKRNKFGKKRPSYDGDFGSPFKKQKVQRQPSPDPPQRNSSVYTTELRRTQSQPALLLRNGSEPYNIQKFSKSTGQDPQKKKAAELLEFRKNLIIYSVREKIIQEIRANQSLIIIGETGSGKTTQIPQFLYEATNQGQQGRQEGIAVTQPRRIAACSVARRVAEEMGSPLGDLVGYHVRFDKKTSRMTRITFLTDGMLLREAMLDPLLSTYHTVVLDEAHERSLETDVLFALLIDIQKKRNIPENFFGKKIPPLKILVMSATLDVELFENYFSAKVLYVKGRQYPVTVYYTVAPERNYVDAALITTLQIHLDSGPGDILVFLTGRYEIESLAKLLQARAKLLPPKALKLIPCPLFGALSSAAQGLAFEPTPPGTRKVVIATNIAETSITVPSIRYVIDSGMVKARAYISKLGMDILSIMPISQAQARQRAGRAGRTQPGICFRLYMEKDFLNLEQTFLPDILRVNLSGVILLLKAIGIENILEFNFMERPPLESFKRALSELWLLEALNSDGSLSELGKKMAMFPLDPMFSKVMILSKENKCSAEVIAIVAMLSTENVLVTPSLMAEQEGAAQAKQALQAFESPYGDHIMRLRIFEAYRKEKDKKVWCKNRFINGKAMKKVMEVHKQLMDYWKSLQWEIESCTSLEEESDLSYDPICKCFASAFFTRTAVCLPNGIYKNQIDNKQVYIHPSSCLFHKKPEIVIYNELVMTTKQYMRDVLRVKKEWFFELQPQYHKAKSFQSTSKGDM